MGSKIRFWFVYCLLAGFVVTTASMAFAADGDQWSLSGDMTIASNPTPPISPSGDVNATWTYESGGSPMTGSVDGTLVGVVNLEMPDAGIGWYNPGANHVALIKFTTDNNLVAPHGTGDDKTSFVTGSIGGHAPYKAIWTSGSVSGDFTVKATGYNARNALTASASETGRQTEVIVMHNNTELGRATAIGGTHDPNNLALDASYSVTIAPGDTISIQQNGGEWCGVSLDIVPEPTSAILALAGLAMLGLIRRRR